jgi:Ca2+-transporting ATPase
MEIFLLLGGVFLATFFLGLLLEKIRIPWIFAALILGLILAFKNPFSQITDSQTFEFLAKLGMYFLLFLIGFELDLKKIKELGRFIFNSVFFIIFLEAFFGSFLIHYIFNYPWFISALIALSFATVGEEILIPILDEFRLTKTKLGQSILGIGTFDDLIEVLVIILVMISLPFLAGRKMSVGLDWGQILIILFSLAVLALFTVGLMKLKQRASQMRFPKIEAIFLLVLAIFFLFLGIGYLAEETLVALGAILAGLAAKNFLPESRTREIEREIKAVTYGFFGPIFFLWVGLDADIGYLLAYPLLILLIVLVTGAAKILASYLVARKELGTKPSLLMGIALWIRFSTSIVIIKILFEAGVMGESLYSVLIGSAIVFSFVTPFLLSHLIPRWNIGKASDGAIKEGCG